MSIRAPMTGQQAEALAVLLVSLRPGQRRWTKTACFDALTAAGRTKTNDTEALARAAIRAALTASIIDPAIIAKDGEHWELVNALPSNEPARHVRCHICGDYAIHGRHLASDDGGCPGPRRVTTRVSEHADLARALLASFDRKPTPRPRDDVLLPDDPERETTRQAARERLEPTESEAG